MQGQTRLAVASAGQLARQEQDRQRNCRFYRWLRHLHHLQSRQRQCDAVRQCEGGDGLDQGQQLGHQHQQAQHKQQVVQATQNVRYAQAKVTRYRLFKGQRLGRRLPHFYIRRPGSSDMGLAAAVPVLHTHHHIDHGQRQAGKCDARAAAQAEVAAYLPLVQARAGGGQLCDW